MDRPLLLTQLFHVNVEPYTLVSVAQTNGTTTQSFTTSLTNSTQPMGAATNQEMQTETLSPVGTAFNTQSTGTPAIGFLVPATIILLGIAIFGLLAFAGRRRVQQFPVSGNHCEKCGVQLSPNENYCTNCGAKHTKHR